MKNLKDKVVVITGAANGLGRALATAFYGHGCHLALIDIDFIRLERTKRELQSRGQTITIHRTDISVEQHIITARMDILRIHKHIDILVNNAGVSISQYFEQMDLADYKQLFDINFWGAIYSSKHFLPDLKKQNETRLVNIISDFAFMGFPGKTAYGSSKSAMLGFTNALKTELADTNVKVCFVVPPPLNTGLVKSSKHIDDKKRESEARFLEKNGLPIDKAANKIVKQIRRGQYRIIIGRMMFGIDIVARLFPTLLHYFIGKYKGNIDFV